MHYKSHKLLFMMGRVGFEPTKSTTSDLQSDPFGRSGTDPFYIASYYFYAVLIQIFEIILQLSVN